MTAAASALAQNLADHDDDTVLQAVQLLVSQRPHLREALNEVVLSEPPKRYVGVITCFYPDKHYGFIKCDEIQAEYGVDTFLSDREVGLFQTGSTVSFSIAVNGKNQPQARLLEAAGPVSMAPPRRPPQRPTMWAPVWGEPASAAVAAGGCGEERYEGVISSYYPEKTYGFITCEVTKQLYGMDTYLSSHEIGAFSIGDAVSFRVALNKKGNPQARDLQAAQNGGQLNFDPAQGFGLWAGAPGSGDGAPPQKRPRPDWQPQEQQGFLDQAAARYSGTIKSFNPERKYGFISCDALMAQFGIDTFVSDKEIQNFTNGDAVEFSVGFNREGKPQGRALTAAA